MKVGCGRAEIVDEASFAGDMTTGKDMRIVEWFKADMAVDRFSERIVQLRVFLNNLKS